MDINDILIKCRQQPSITIAYPDYVRVLYALQSFPIFVSEMFTETFEPVPSPLKAGITIVAVKPVINKQDKLFTPLLVIRDLCQNAATPLLLLLYRDGNYLQCLL